MGQFSKDMVAFLETKGFRQFPWHEAHCVALQRRLGDEEYAGIPGCSLNDGKLHLNAYVHEFPIPPEGRCMNGLAIELTAQDADGRSFKIEQYGSRFEGSLDEHTEHFDETCRRLVRGWAAIVGWKPEKPITVQELVTGSKWVLDGGAAGSVMVELLEPPWPPAYASVYVRVVTDPLPRDWYETGVAFIEQLRRIRL